MPTSLQNVIIGLIILLAVGIDMWRKEIGGVLHLFALPADRTAAQPSKPREERTP